MVLGDPFRIGTQAHRLRELMSNVYFALRFALRRQDADAFRAKHLDCIEAIAGAHSAASLFLATGCAMRAGVVA